MRLRSFNGKTMAEAMGLVRRHLGPEAVIVGTEEDPDGSTRVIAAVDEAEVFAFADQEDDVLDILSDALGRHGLAPALVEKILAAALPFDTSDPADALEGALSALYGFQPLLAEGAAKSFLLVGAPGAGKTVSIAKLAARAVMAGERVRLVTADTARAGGIEQLEAFAKILKLKLHAVEDARQLAPIAAAAASAGELLLVDTPGVNPYSAGDRRELGRLIKASNAEPVLVMAAGGDAVDSVEMARIFRDLGAARMILTRLDMVHRLGAAIAVAEEIELGFADAGIAPAIADGITPLTPAALARLLLPQRSEGKRLEIGRRGSP